jgi:hypothetical protein
MAAVKQARETGGFLGRIARIAAGAQGTTAQATPSDAWRFPLAML